MTRLERRENAATPFHSGRRHGFTYAETLLTTLLLALCTGALCSALNVCLGQMRGRADDAQALLLLSAVRDAVRNDLTHATRYRESDGAFQSGADRPPDAWTRYDDWTAFPMIPAEMRAGPDAEMMSAEVRLEFQSGDSLFFATVRIYDGERKLLADDSFSVIPIGSVEVVP